MPSRYAVTWPCLLLVSRHSSNAFRRFLDQPLHITLNSRMGVWLNHIVSRGGALVAHLPFGFHSRASFCASAIWAGVICLAVVSRSSAAGLSPFVAARLYHL